MATRVDDRWKGHCSVRFSSSRNTIESCTLTACTAFGQISRYLPSLHSHRPFSAPSHQHSSTRSLDYEQIQDEQESRERSGSFRSYGIVGDRYYQMLLDEGRRK